ncbi:MAG: ATP-binding protein [Vulcanimicrobiota bacterium]
MRLKNLLTLALVALSLLVLAIYSALFRNTGLADAQGPPPVVFHFPNSREVHLAEQHRWPELRHHLGTVPWPPDTAAAYQPLAGERIQLRHFVDDFPQNLIDRSDEAGTWLLEVHPDFVYQVFPIHRDGRLDGHVLVHLTPGPRFNEHRRPAMVTARWASATVALLVCLMMVQLASRRSAVRLEELAQAALSLSAGQRRRLDPPRVPLELAQLGEAFNTMSDQLEERMARLVEARQAAEEADRLRRDFIADIAHGIGTPLASIHLRLQSLGSLTPSERSQAEKKLLRDIAWVSQASRRLLDLSVWETVEPELRLTEFDLMQPVMETIETLEEPLLEAGMELDLKDLRALQVRADLGAVREILVALLENCVKHSGGNCRLLVRAEESEGQVEVTIRDEGVGMGEEQLSRAAQRHYTTGGSGLGLAIARRLVEAHGSRLSITSAPGQGVEFRFRLDS